MVMNPYLTQLLMEEHVKEALREVEQAWLVKMAQIRRGHGVLTFSDAIGLCTDCGICGGVCPRHISVITKRLIEGAFNETSFSS